ncbi:MAG: 50S ribosomal protein L35 [Candidatus Aminicenantes bacterium]|nr:50S ribosomal protein L35 [Candidatus Aminicenantes bacterium]MDH5714540.1 50S ribosomal protein L35 [Candidatus Aminicenantes bacterium]
MPKLKTKKGAAKRFHRTASGKILRNKACRSHLLTKKTSKRKRSLRKKEVVSSRESGKVRKMLPYS